MSSSSSSAGPNWMERHPVMCTVSAAIIASMITGGATYTAQRDKDAEPVEVAPTGEITEPASVKVGSKVRLSGWIKDLPKGYAIWGFNAQESSGQLWPLYSPCVVNEAKTTWTCPDVRVGGANDGPGSEWKLRVFAVTAQDVVDIKAYAIAKEYKGENPDFSTLSEDATLIDEMKVIRE